MKRLYLWFLCVTILLMPHGPVSGVDLSVMPPTPEKKALEVPYFPNRICTFIWRNWNQIPLDSMAKTIKTEETKIAEIAAIMGLPPYKEPTWTVAQHYINDSTSQLAYPAL